MPVTVIQSKYAEASTTGQTSLSATFTSNPTAGSAIVALIGWFTGTNSVSSVSDTVDSFGTAITSKQGTGTNPCTVYAYAALNVSGAGANKTVTVTFSGAVDYPSMKIFEVSQIAASAATDGTGTSGGNVTASGPTMTTAVTTANAADIVFMCAYSTWGANTSDGSPWTSAIDGTNLFVSEYQIVSSAGTYTAAPVEKTGANGNYSGLIFGLKASGVNFVANAAAKASATDTPSIGRFFTVNGAAKASAIDTPTIGRNLSAAVAAKASPTDTPLIGRKFTVNAAAKAAATDTLTIGGASNAALQGRVAAVASMYLGTLPLIGRYFTATGTAKGSPAGVLQVPPNITVGVVTVTQSGPSAVVVSATSGLLVKVFSENVVVTGQL